MHEKKMQERQHWVQIAPGIRRFGRSWWPTNTQPLAVLCIIPGLGEHSGRYADFAESMGPAGLALVSLDLQGQGLSPGRRGCVESYDSLLGDLAACVQLGRCIAEEVGSQRAEDGQTLLDLTRANLSVDRKVVLYGHSMGGNLVLNSVLRKIARPDGVISSSPMMSAGKPMSKAYLACARFLMRLFPNYQLKAPVKTEYLSRDTAEQSAYKNDPLVHRLVSLRLGASLIDSGQWALEHAAELDTPTLLMHGMLDKITDPVASQEFAKRAGAICTGKFFPDLLHDTHRDIGRDAVLEAMFSWMRERLSLPLLATQAG